MNDHDATIHSAQLAVKKGNQPLAMQLLALAGYRLVETKEGPPGFAFLENYQLCDSEEAAIRAKLSDLKYRPREA